MAAGMRAHSVERIVSSPARRARQTAEALRAEQPDATVTVDARARERIEFDPEGVDWTWDEFTAEWARCAADADFEPRQGDSSRRTGQRMRELLREMLRELTPRAGSLALVTHEGAILDLLRLVSPQGVVVPKHVRHASVTPLDVAWLND